MKYRKRPIIIEAFRFFMDESPPWFDEAIQKRRITIYSVQEKDATPEDMYCVIKTLEGEMVASFGDYIIKGIEGEFYPCRPSIFEMTYEKIND